MTRGEVRLFTEISLRYYTVFNAYGRGHWTNNDANIAILQILHLHIGQAGTQLGNSAWELCVLFHIL